MTDLERAIWEWLPGRRDRTRVTDTSQIVLHMNTSARDVVHALERMVRDGRVLPTVWRGRTSYHRGPWPHPPTSTDPGLWETT